MYGIFLINNLMVKFIKHISFLVLTLALVLGSFKCEKDEASPKQLLTGKQWRLTAWTTTPAYEVEGGMISNLYSLLPVCAHDDFTIFDTDGTLIKDEGEVKCSQGDPQTTSGSWLMNTNQTMLQITIEGGETEYIIDEISDNFLILGTQEVIEHATGSITYEYRFTYTRM